MKSGLPKSSLIICSRDRPQLLLETVESVLRGDQVPTELIVVDQSVTPHPKLSVIATERPCQIRYLHSKTIGVGAARNLGILSSSYSILAFLDDDMFVAPDWFGKLV
jgi:glycosyltransferase involved in cell wall biosynthesis